MMVTAPIHLAAEHGDVAEVERLLETVDVNIRDGIGQTPLHCAASACMQRAGDVSKVM